MFKKAAAILHVHNEILGPAIDDACRVGEARIAAREAQASFDARATPRSAAVARPVFARERSRLAGFLHADGALLLRSPGADGDALVAFRDGFSLSDLRRLCDRVDGEGRGTLTAGDLAAACRDDADVAAAFADLVEEGGGDLDFARDVVPRLWRGATRFAPGAVAPGSKLRAADVDDLRLVFGAHADDDGHLRVEALRAAFGDLEGRVGAAEIAAEDRARADFGARLTFGDLARIRERHCSDAGVPVDADGLFVGAGINGWRRRVLERLRPLWRAAVADAARTSGRYVRAAPGPRFVDALRKAEAVRPFLNLEVAEGASLRDVFADVATASFDAADDASARRRRAS